MDRLAPGFFPARATVQANTPTRSASGHPTPAWTPVVGLRNIPAAVSPNRFSRSGESRRTELTIAESSHRVGLAGAYPAITAKHRVVVTGPGAGTYDITRPQTDGQTGLTVLECRTVSPVAAAGL
jgi:head-tail adaptor